LPPATRPTRCSATAPGRRGRAACRENRRPPRRAGG
jgi:hypothetical protein